MSRPLARWPWRMERTRWAASRVLWLVLSARAEDRSLFTTNPFGNRFLLGSALGALALCWGATQWQPAAELLGFVPLSGAQIQQRAAGDDGGRRAGGWAH